jgi:hypothetical protein
MFQKEIRAHYQDKPFSEFVDKVCERRLRHKMDSDIHLQFSPEQQNRAENWKEFQNYHLQHLEQLEERRDNLKGELDVDRRKVANIGVKDAAAVQQLVEATERSLEKVINNLLPWIERERLVIEKGHPKSVEEGYNDQNVALNTRNNRKKRPETRAVLGKVGITKVKRKKRNMQIQTPHSPKLEPAVPTTIQQDLVDISRSSITQAPKNQETKPRHSTKEMP